MSNSSTNILERIQESISKQISNVSSMSLRAKEDNSRELSFTVGEITSISCTYAPDIGMMTIRGDVAPKDAAQMDLEAMGKQCDEAFHCHHVISNNVLMILLVIPVEEGSKDANIVESATSFIVNIAMRVKAFDEPNAKPAEPPLSVDDSATLPTIDNAAEEDAPQAAAPFHEGAENTTPNLEQPLSPQSPQCDEADSAKANLEQMLIAFDQTAPLGTPPCALTHEDLAASEFRPTEKHTSADPKNSINYLDAILSLQGDDPCEVVSRTRELESAVQRIQDELASAFAEICKPMYHAAIAICNGTASVQQREAATDATMSLLLKREEKLNKSEQQLLIERQDLLRNRQEFEKHSGEMTQIRQQNTTLTGLTEVQRAQIEKLGEDLAEAQSEAARLRQDFDALKQQVEDGVAADKYGQALLQGQKKMEEYIAMQAGRLKACNDVIDAFRSSMENWNRSEANYKGQISDLQATIAGLNNEIAAQGETVAQLRSDLQTAKAEQSAPIVDVSMLQKDFEAATLRADHAESKLTEANGEIHKLRQELADAQSSTYTFEGSPSDLSGPSGFDDGFVVRERRNPSATAREFVTMFAETGLALEVVPGASELIIGGTYKAQSGHYDVKIDAAHGIIYVEKIIKGVAKRRAKEVGELDKQDMFVIYSMTPNKVRCRIFLKDIKEAPLKLLDVIASLAGIS